MIYILLNFSTNRHYLKMTKRGEKYDTLCICYGLSTWHSVINLNAFHVTLYFSEWQLWRIIIWILFFESILQIYNNYMLELFSISCQEFNYSFVEFTKATTMLVVVLAKFCKCNKLVSVVVSSSSSSHSSSVFFSKKKVFLNITKAYLD